MAIGTASLLPACSGETETTTSENTTPEVTEQVEEVIPVVQFTPDTSQEETILAYLKEKKWDGVRHESGMYVVTENAGTGEARPNLLDEVTIFYKGYLLDGSQFDGTTTEPATFPLANLILGWQIGIPMFGEGGKGKLIIPPGLAYGPDDVTGPDGSVSIPGNSVLMFEIELVSWKKAPAQPQFMW